MYEQDKRMLEFTPRVSVGVSMAGFITTKEAAELMKVTISYVRQMARNGDIKAQRFGRDWQIDEDAARAFKRSAAGFPIGRKRTPTQTG